VSSRSPALRTAAAAAAAASAAAAGAAAGRVGDGVGQWRGARPADRLQPAGRRLAARPGRQSPAGRRQSAAVAAQSRQRQLVRRQRAAEALPPGRRRRQLPLQGAQLVDHRLRGTTPRGRAAVRAQSKLYRTRSI